MDLDNPESKAYLFELYTMTRGDTDAQVSMYDVGEVLGLEKAAAGSMAEDLFIQGFAELKTLSGGIGITREGMRVLDVNIPPGPGDEFLQLGTATILEDPGKTAVDKILQDIQETISRTNHPYEHLEEMVVDIKTIDVQMLSPFPKTQIIREILRSLHTRLTGSGPADLVEKLDRLITS